MMELDAPYLLLGRITRADVAAFVAERLARGLGIDTEREMPRLRSLTKWLAETPPLPYRAITEGHHCDLRREEGECWHYVSGIDREISDVAMVIFLDHPRCR